MKYNDLEKTKEIFDIEEDVPTPIEDIEMEGISKNNVTDEFTLGLSETLTEKKEPEESKKDKKDKKNKRSLKEIWNSFSKKKKIITIVSISLVFILVIALVLILVLKKEKSPTDNPPEPEVPTVIVEKENYIYKNGTLTLLDSSDKELGTYECKNKDEKLCYVAYYSDEDTFDISKNIYEDENVIERRSSIYSDNFVFIYDNKEEKNGLITLYNIKEQKEEGTYTLVKGFADSNYVILKDNNSKYGTILFNQDSITEKIKFTFDYLGMMSKDSKIVAKTNNKYFIYTIDGKLESKGLSYEIKSYNNKYIVVDNNGYYLYDYQSNLVFDSSYDFIGLTDNYVSVVKDNNLYIKDYNNQKYNEDGIELSNKYYNETNIYDAEKKLVSTKVAYKIAIVEDNIEVTYYTKTDKEKTVSLSQNEGKLNSNHAYINYLNGKLYFYKDEEKNNLLGSYTCTNKNSVGKDTKEYSNCLIASNSFYSKNEVEIDNSANTGWIPIINERYVFILDSLNLSNPTIMLYDLKTNKTLSKYISVDTGLYTKDKAVTFKTSNNLYIMANNRSNKYGAIKIEDEVKSAIAFNYSSIEKLRDYYMAREASGTYVLLNNAGEEVTSKYGYKIVDYKGNYLKVIDNEKYSVYDFKGNKVDATEYLYIDLQDDYYAVITIDKKIDIHKYTDQTFKLTNPIDIGNVADYKNAFEVTKNSEGYTIKLKATNQTINIPADGNNSSAIE